MTDNLNSSYGRRPNGKAALNVFGETTPVDSEDNEILPAFSPGTTSQLSATITTTNRVAVGSSTTVRITSIANFTPPEGIIRIAFGDSSVQANATTDMPVNVDVDVELKVFYIPSTATHIAYVRETNCTGNVAFEITLS